MFKSDFPLTVVFKNFFRNKAVNLTAASIRYFLPNANISSVNLYKKDQSEYDSQPKLENITEYYRQTKYFDIGPSAANPKNNLFFSEGYNLIYDIFRETNDKVLMICEDHFFTSGQTLKELVEVEFDLAYGNWNGSGPNASMLCIRPKSVSHAFPISETSDKYVEQVFTECLINRVKNRYAVSTRGPDGDYHGDGIYTNDADVIEKELKKVGIL